MSCGLDKLFQLYIMQLQTEREDIALLQLTGNIEDYLVRRFVLHVHSQTDGKCFALAELKEGGGSPIDICVLKGRTSWEKEKDKSEICAMIEAKYIKNRAKFWKVKSNNTAGALQDLGRQLQPFEENKYATYPVKLDKNKDIHGLVFCSFVSHEIDNKEKEDFFRRIEEHKHAKRFKPYRSGISLQHVYDDIKVNILGYEFYTTLRLGLWVKK